MPSQVRTKPSDHKYISLLHIHRKAEGLDKNMSDTMAHVVDTYKLMEKAKVPDCITQHKVCQKCKDCLYSLPCFGHTPIEVPLVE